MLRNCFPGRHRFQVVALLLVLVACGLRVAPPAAAANGTLKVIAVDQNGVLIKGACYFFSGNMALGACDVTNANGLNGVVVMSLPPGSHGVYERRVPPGYRFPGGMRVTVSAGQQTTVRLVHRTGASILRIRTIDQDTNALVAAACYRSGNVNNYFACDADDGTLDGIVRFGGITNDTYEVLEQQPVTGYFPDTTVETITFNSSSSKTLVWPVEKIVYSDRVNVRLVTNFGRLMVTGGCFSLIDQTHAVQICDGDDGMLDGWTVFPAVRPGNYTLTLDNYDSLGLMRPPAKSITKVDGQILSYTINAQRQITI